MILKGKSEVKGKESLPMPLFSTTDLRGLCRTEICPLR